MLSTRALQATLIGLCRDLRDARFSRSRPDRTTPRDTSLSSVGTRNHATRGLAQDRSISTSARSPRSLEMLTSETKVVGAGGFEPPTP